MNHLTRKIGGALAAAALLLTGAAAVAQAAPTAIGHRGATGVAGYPEETTRALAYAATHGAEIAEGDVLFTAPGDDEPIMIHDRTYDRTTDCTGPVVGKTFAQMRLCAPPSVVPSLLTWLAHVKSHDMIALLEIRSNPLPSAAQLDKVIAQINLNFPRQLVISSFDPAVLELMETRLGDRALYAPIIHQRTADGVESLYGYSISEHAAQYELIIADYRWFIVDRMHWYADAGVAVWLYTATSADSITRTKALANAEPDTSAIVADDVADITGL
jgi:glycerophosphoryl diester phosphodiesterase